MMIYGYIYIYIYMYVYICEHHFLPVTCVLLYANFVSMIAF